MSKTIAKKLFYNKNGKLTIVQFPNIYLMTWIVATLANRLISSQDLSALLVVVSFIALLLWSLLEIISGDNHFRRLLGLFVLIAMIAARIGSS